MVSGPMMTIGRCSLCADGSESIAIRIRPENFLVVLEGDHDED